MNIDEFKQKYPNLITKFREENPHKCPFLNTRITKFFLYWLQQQKNLKVTYKRSEQTEIKQYNHISEFFSNFLKEHAYFSQHLIIGIYTDKIQPSVDEYGEIKKEFGKLIREHVKYGILEKYNRDTYKINKELVESYSKS